MFQLFILLNLKRSTFFSTYFNSNNKVSSKKAQITKIKIKMIWKKKYNLKLFFDITQYLILQK